MFKLLLLLAFLDYWFLGRWHVVVFLIGFFVNDWVRSRWSFSQTACVQPRQCIDAGRHDGSDGDPLGWEWVDAVRQANCDLVRANNDLYRQNFTLRNLLGSVNTPSPPSKLVTSAPVILQ